jgi:hypothetical protein
MASEHAKSRTDRHALIRGSFENCLERVQVISAHLFKTACRPTMRLYVAGTRVEGTFSPPQGFQDRLQKVLAVTRQALNNLINGKSGISADMALRLDKAFGACGKVVAPSDGLRPRPGPPA